MNRNIEPKRLQCREATRDFIEKLLVTKSRSQKEISQIFLSQHEAGVCSCDD